jgi:NAD(P)-dependent dehydrogenase (short-subunit alcohol dehydrogenase family)
MRLEGKVAVITGAGSGMGRAMAILFAAEGAKLAVNDYNATTLKETVSAVQAEGGEIIGVQGNVAVQADAESLIDAALDTYGRIDVLCNNAGVNDLFQRVGELTNEAWERVIGINLNGPMFTSRRVVPIMVKQGGGSIINIASAASLGGGPAGVAYTVSKHGVLGLTRSTAWMYINEGIRCNAICPGGVVTNIPESSDMTKADPGCMDRILLYVSIMPGMGQPIDIAHLALFLASDESKFINGAIISADGGWRAA